MEEIKRCSNCGKPIIDKFAFCPFCGEKLAKQCKNCGEPLVEGASFCPNCGTRIENAVQQEPVLQCDECRRDEVQDAPCNDFRLIEVQDTQRNDFRFTEAQHSQSACFAQPSCAKKKSNKKTKHSANGILTLVKRATVAFVCVLLFALSFVGVLNINVGNALNGILGSVDDDLIEGDVSIYAIDCIELAFATARHYDEDKDVAKIEKLEDELNEISEDLLKSLEDDVRGTRIVLSKESENLLRKFTVKTLEYQLSIDNATSTGGVRVEIIVAGTLFLANLAFAFAMAIAALVAFATYLKSFLAGQEDDKHSKLDFFVPLLLILPVCAIMPLASATSLMEVAGTMIAALFFASLAIAVCLAQRLVADAKVAKTAKILVPRIATLALALVVLGCCFAPCFKAVFEVQFSGKSSPAMCETTLDASAMANLITTKEQQEGVWYIRQYERYIEDAKTICDILPNYTSKNFMAADELVAKAFAQALIFDGVLAQISYEGAAALSLGFFLLIAVMLLVGVYLGGTIVGGKSAKWANLGLAIAIVLLLLCSLALSVVTMKVANKTMTDIKTDAFDVQLGGGIISAIVFAAAMIVFNAIPDKVWSKKKEEIQLQNE